MKRSIQQISKQKTIKIFLFAFLLFAAGTTNAQVGIGTATPNASARLDVSSTNKGFLPPRMTHVERNAIPNPAAGLMIWCKDCGASGEMQVFNGSVWASICETPFSSVVIGSQTWMSRNLDVTRYANGDIIPEVPDNGTWGNLTTGAWCYYNNDPGNGFIYGKLYNWYAVHDPRGLAPVGWHVPDNSEWTTLANFLGGASIAGGKMKATILWDPPGGDNSSGFAALPGGYRSGTGSNGIRLGCNMWSSSVNTSVELTYGNYNNILIGNFYGERIGLSVRCVKD